MDKVSTSALTARTREERGEQERKVKRRGDEGRESGRGEGEEEETARRRDAQC